MFAGGEAIHEDNGRGGMGCRVREDNGMGRVCPPPSWGQGFDTRTRRGGFGFGRGGMGWWVLVHEGKLFARVTGGGWVPAFARTTGADACSCSGGEGWVGGLGRTREGGAGEFAGGGMGWRMREDNGTGANSCSGGEGWVPACVRTRDEGGFVFGRGGMGWRMREDTEGEGFAPPS